MTQPSLAHSLPNVVATSCLLQCCMTFDTRCTIDPSDKTVQFTLLLSASTSCCKIAVVLYSSLPLQWPPYSLSATSMSTPQPPTTPSHHPQLHPLPRWSLNDLQATSDSTMAPSSAARGCPASLASSASSSSNWTSTLWLSQNHSPWEGYEAICYTE